MIRPRQGEEIALLLSGGVDSSVALRLLQEQGHRPTAFYLKIWLQEELAFLGDCPWEEDLAYARAVCEQAGVELQVIPLQEEYWERVVSYVVQELRAGHTPSPDLLCNSRIKFGAFMESAGSGFSRVASGHYARLDHESQGSVLRRGVDPVKDQSYFLARMRPEQLARCLFPLGALPKVRVRELAARWNLPNRERRDSQGICFLGKIPYDEFVRHHLGTREGRIIVEEDGSVIGRHEGYWYYTIGQRKGIGLHGGPWYVVDKDIGENVIYVAHAERLAARRCRRFRAGSPNWLQAEAPEGRLQCRLRHGPRLWDCHVTPEDGERWQVALDVSDPGVAAGQFTVFYDGERCLGSAVVEKILEREES